MKWTKTGVEKNCVAASNVNVLLSASELDPMLGDILEDRYDGQTLRRQVEPDKYSLCLLVSMSACMMNMKNYETYYRSARLRVLTSFNKF